MANLSGTILHLTIFLLAKQHFHFQKYFNLISNSNVSRPGIKPSLLSFSQKGTRPMSGIIFVFLKGIGSIASNTVATAREVLEHTVKSYVRTYVRTACTYVCTYVRACVRTYGRTDRQADGRTDGRTDRRMKFLWNVLLVVLVWILMVNSGK